MGPPRTVPSSHSVRRPDSSWWLMHRWFHKGLWKQKADRNDRKVYACRSGVVCYTLAASIFGCVPSLVLSQKPKLVWIPGQVEALEGGVLQWRDCPSNQRRSSRAPGVAYPCPASLDSGPACGQDHEGRGSRRNSRGTDKISAESVPESLLTQKKGGVLSGSASFPFPLPPSWEMTTRDKY